VKDLDRFDMILQAFEYETDERRPSKDLQEFFTSCEGMESLQKRYLKVCFVDFFFVKLCNIFRAIFNSRQRCYHRCCGVSLFADITSVYYS